MPRKSVAKVISATKASNNFGSLINEAAKGDSYFVITRMGKARAVVLGIEQYSKLLDDLEIKGEEANSQFQKSLREARKEYELGEIMTEKEFDKEFEFTDETFLGKSSDHD